VQGFDPAKCVDNVGGSDVSFKNFERHFTSNQTRRTHGFDFRAWRTLHSHDAV
jgi:hypothetical protein